MHIGHGRWRNQRITEEIIKKHQLCPQNCCIYLDKRIWLRLNHCQSNTLPISDTARPRGWHYVFHRIVLLYFYRSMGAAESTNLVRRLFHHETRQQTWLKLALRALAWLPVALAVLAVSLFAIDRWVSYQAKDQLFTNSEQIESFDVAVVLGTSKYLGKILNEYYTNRIDAAIELYQQGKVDNFLLSGDNAHRSYNEPWTMKRDLLKAEIPEESIFLDYAGFRTLDSVVRAKEIFDTNNFLIISQKFHCERAIFIANSHNIDAKCFAVAGPSKHSGFQVRMREVFARAKAVLDIYITDAKPKFLGPKEPILIEQLPEPEIEPELAEQSLISQPES